MSRIVCLVILGRVGLGFTVQCDRLGQVGSLKLTLGQLLFDLALT